MSVCALVDASLGEPSIFANLPHYKPIATKTGCFSKHDHEFIDHEITWLLTEGIIGPGTSSGQALAIIVKDPLL